MFPVRRGSVTEFWWNGYVVLSRALERGRLLMLQIEHLADL